MKPLIISAPFGNYLNFPNATSTLGTFTLYKRAGFLKRWWRVLSTVRYNRRQQSWINRLGLPNPGIESLPVGVDYSDKIISIHASTDEEWVEIVKRTCLRKPLAVEFNLSCPNVPGKDIVKTANTAIRVAIVSGLTVIAKLPPVRWLEFALPLFDFGVRAFHCCNTIPSPGGGISGKPLKQFSMWAVEELRALYENDVILIGGGGVTGQGDVEDYLKATADHVALGSWLLNPFNWQKVNGLDTANVGWWRSVYDGETCERCGGNGE